MARSAPAVIRPAGTSSNAFVAARVVLADDVARRQSRSGRGDRARFHRGLRPRPHVRPDDESRVRARDRRKRRAGSGCGGDRVSRRFECVAGGHLLEPPRRKVHATSAGAYEIATLAPGDYYLAAVSTRLALNWQDPEFLERLIAGATESRWARRTRRPFPSARSRPRDAESCDTDSSPRSPSRPRLPARPSPPGNRATPARKPAGFRRGPVCFPG